MIYTIGKKDIYEPYIANDPNAAKRAGGSVWKTYEEVSDYKTWAKLEDYDIYGIDADWEMDTHIPIDSEDRVGDFRSLKRNAKLIKLDCFLKSSK